MRHAIAVLALLASAVPASAQQACMDGKQFFDRAASRFGEHMTNFGIAADGRTRIIVMSSKAGGWTLASMSAIGVVCVMASGTDWQEAPLPKEKGSEL